MSDGRTTVVETVQAWHDAVNARDVEAAVALCTADVQVVGPKGTGAGHDLMRAWLTRSGISLEPQHPLREVDGRVLVHEVAQWHTAGQAPVGAPVERPVDTWVVFAASEGRLTSVARYETEDDALRAVAAPA